MSAPALFPRHIAVLILVLLACAFAGNHIAARIAFTTTPVCFWLSCAVPV